jgi:hypothetical protein
MDKCPFNEMVWMNLSLEVGKTRPNRPIRPDLQKPNFRLKIADPGLNWIIRVGPVTCITFFYHRYNYYMSVRGITNEPKLPKTGFTAL